MYFKSKTAEYIFYLLELDGEARASKLNITASHYRRKNKARIWRENMMEILNEGDHEYKAAAIKKLNEIYKDMIEP